MITNLAHVCLVVRDLEASIAFYADQLGLTPAFDFVNDQGVRFGIYLHLGGRNFLELFQGQPGEAAGPFQHICLEVDDIDATVAALRANDVEVSDPKLGTDRSWQAWLTDPDGVRIELHAYTAESKQAAWLA